MGRPATQIHKGKIDPVGGKLDEMERNPPTVSMREFIVALLPKILKVKEAGYTFDEISKVFNQEGIPISAASLKKHVSQLSPPKADSPKSELKELSPLEPKFKSAQKLEKELQPQPEAEVLETVSQANPEPEIEPNSDAEPEKKHKDQDQVKSRFRPAREK